MFSGKGELVKGMISKSESHQLTVLRVDADFVKRSRDSS